MTRLPLVAISTPGWNGKSDSVKVFGWESKAEREVKLPAAASTGFQWFLTLRGRGVEVGPCGQPYFRELERFMRV
jgi:hypothetical protein